MAVATLLLEATDAGKVVTIPAGFTWTVYGTDAVDSIDLAPGASATIFAGLGNDVIRLLGSSADYTVQASGSNVIFTHVATGAKVTTAATGGAGDSVAFGPTGTPTPLKITGGAIVLGAQTLGATPAPVNTGGTSASTPVSVDGQGTADVPAILASAATGAFNYTDNVATINNVTINSFGTDDRITISGSTSAIYDNAISFTGTDVHITYNSAGVVNIIHLMGVNPTAALIFDVASFNALPVGDIFF